MSQAQVLVADDDTDTRGLVRHLLERAGHRVLEAADGREAVRVLFADRPDLVLLDVTMPQLDGWTVLERIRDVSDVPVMMLTASGAELERVRGLRGGADDYLPKPFGRQELLARVESLLRRAGLGRAPASPTYADAYLEIDFSRAAVRVGDRDVRLTPLEFRLLAALVRNAGIVLSHQQLLDLVWDDPFGVSRAQVKLYVGYLRRKLEPAAPLSAPIETVRGFGYRYEVPAA